MHFICLKQTVRIPYKIFTVFFALGVSISFNAVYHDLLQKQFIGRRQESPLSSPLSLLNVEKALDFNATFLVKLLKRFLSKENWEWN